MRRLFAPILAVMLGLGAGVSTPARPASPAPLTSAAAPASHPDATAHVGWRHWWEAYTYSPPGWSMSSTTHEVTGVAATLVVPRVTSVGSLGNYIWIGVGVGKLLVQNGVWVGAPGASQDWAWVATCPGCHPISSPAKDRVEPGDHLSFSIGWLGGDQWVSTIVDTTSGWVWVDPLVSPAPVGYLAQWATEYGPVAYSGGGFRWWQPTVTVAGGPSQPASANGELIDAGTLGFYNQRHLIVRNSVSPPHATVTRLGANVALLRAFGPLPSDHHMHIVHRVVVGGVATTTAFPVSDPGAWALRCAPPDESCLLALVTARGATMAFARFSPGAPG